MDDFYEFIIGDEGTDDMDMVDETDLEPDDFDDSGVDITIDIAKE